MTSLTRKQSNYVTVQVVLEYQWTPARDLIPGVQAEMVSAADPELKHVSHDVKLSSILDSLAAKSFGLQPDQRLSY